jgi:hypothetical protein
MASKSTISNRIKSALLSHSSEGKDIATIESCATKKNDPDNSCFALGSVLVPSEHIGFVGQLLDFKKSDERLAIESLAIFTGAIYQPNHAQPIFWDVISYPEPFSLSATPSGRRFVGTQKPDNRTRWNNIWDFHSRYLVCYGVKNVEQ